MNNVDFTVGEVSLICVAVEEMRSVYEENLDDRASLSDMQINNLIDNVAACNSVLRKLKKMLKADSAGR